MWRHLPFACCSVSRAPSARIAQPISGAFLARTLGPLFPAHRKAKDNIRRAFPGIAEEEVKRITREAWDNLGRTSAEYAHLDTIFDFDPERPRRGADRGFGHTLFRSPAR